LRTFPWIASRVAAGKLMVHGAWLAIRRGKLMVLRGDGCFEDGHLEQEAFDQEKPSPALANTQTE
jgi:hypothetical protein